MYFKSCVFFRVYSLHLFILREVFILPSVHTIHTIYKHPQRVAICTTTATTERILANRPLKLRSTSKSGDGFEMAGIFLPNISSDFIVLWHRWPWPKWGSNYEQNVVEPYRVKSDLLILPSCKYSIRSKYTDIVAKHCPIWSKVAKLHRSKPKQEKVGHGWPEMQQICFMKYDSNIPTGSTMARNGLIFHRKRLQLEQNGTISLQVAKNKQK